MKSSVAGLALAFLTLPAVAQVSPAPHASQKPAKAVKAAADPAAGEARAAVTRTLKDPESAQFQNVRAKNTVSLRGQPMQVVCGDVNAKNSYGGFTGFTPWIYLVDMKSAHVLGPDRDIVTADMLKNFCG